MKSTIPERVQTGPQEWFTVRQSALGGKKGYVDLDAKEIVLEEALPEAGKHTILVHELIHVMCEKLIAADIIPGHPPEAFVTHLSGTLMATLVLSGLYPAVTPEQQRELMRGEVRG